MGSWGHLLFALVAISTMALPAYADESVAPPPLARQESYDPFAQTVNTDQASAPAPGAYPTSTNTQSGLFAPVAFITASNTTPHPAVAPVAQASTAQQPCAGGCPPGTCPQCVPCPCACVNPFEHKCNVYGEYLYIRAFDIDMAHGIQQNGVGGLGTAPAGEVGTLQPQFDSGFRFGGELSCDCCSGVRAAYTQYDTSTDNRIDAPPGIGGTTASLVLFPNTVTAASTFDFLVAHYDIRFKLADVEYSVLLSGSDVAALNFDIGARYAHLDQGFSQLGEFAGATGEELTTTTIGFDGGGLRTGFDGAWRLHNSRFALYGKGYANIIFGQFNSHYLQHNVTTDTDEAFSHWTDSRVMPILEYEAGLQWVSCSGCCRLSAGYLTSFWFNAVDTGEWVRAVQTQNFTNVGNTIAFTGLSAHAEVRF